MSSEQVHEPLLGSQSRPAGAATVETVVKPPSEQTAQQGPQQHTSRTITIQPSPILVNHQPWRAICAFILLGALDVAINAGAGSAAARIGASKNGRDVTSEVVNTGALIGAIKSAMLISYEIISVSRAHYGVHFFAYFITTSLVMTFIFTVVVSLQTLGEGESPSASLFPPSSAKCG